MISGSPTPLVAIRVRPLSLPKRTVWPSGDHTGDVLAPISTKRLSIPRRVSSIDIRVAGIPPLVATVTTTRLPSGDMAVYPGTGAGSPTSFRTVRFRSTHANWLMAGAGSSSSEPERQRPSRPGSQAPWTLRPDAWCSDQTLGQEAWCRESTGESRRRVNRPRLHGARIRVRRPLSGSQPTLRDGQRARRTRRPFVPTYRRSGHAEVCGWNASVTPMSTGSPPEPDTAWALSRPRRESSRRGFHRRPNQRRRSVR